MHHALRVAAIGFVSSVIGLLAATNAVGQVCGDADGNGSVTVTDGVNVLRAAASLTSNCTTAVCDVDGNGTITVTDGVNVLRNAAGLTSVQNCAGGTSADVEAAVSSTLPFLTFGIGLTSGATTSSAQAAGTDDCPDGGTREDDEGIPTRRITLTACRVSNQLGSFQIDGTIDVTIGIPATVTFDITVMDLDNDRTVEATGFVEGTPASGGGFVIDGGPIIITTPQGRFTVRADNLTINGDGELVSGSASVEDTDDNFELESIELTVVQGTGTADVVATFDDQHTENFVLDLDTGELTPAP